MRGNQYRHSGTDAHTRSIPACAGEPGHGRDLARADRVYPRVCGGTKAPGGYRRIEGGLSPRVRGNQGVGAGPCMGKGSIPACAGEPLLLGALYVGAEVYPRVCGGTVRILIRCEIDKGLSPRVRGNHAVPKVDSQPPGSIPACAGEPRSKRTIMAAMPVYPRVCGGTIDLPVRAMIIRGLSPRVRGNLMAACDFFFHNGSIPACAGEPPALPSDIPLCEVYPRVCGGTVVLVLGGHAQQGLSPRVRGNRHYATMWNMPTRSIPACAGEPIARDVCSS